jgi:type III secretion protein SpaR/YscT/HrcT
MTPLDGLERTLLAVGLGAARTLPVSWLIPAFGGPLVPAPVRVGLGLGLSVLCLPRLTGQVPPSAGVLLWVLLLARELAVGLTLGFVGSLIFRAAEMAGRLTDVLRGANLAEVLSPLSQERSSPLGELTLFLAVVIFLELGGLGHVATALARSYDAVPVAATTVPAHLGQAAALALAASGQMLESALGLAAPAIVALLLADLALGAVARAAPQIPVYFVGMPLKALLGVAATLLGVGALQQALDQGFRGWAGLLERAVAVWR